MVSMITQTAGEPQFGLFPALLMYFAVICIAYSFALYYASSRKHYQPMRPKVKYLGEDKVSPWFNKDLGVPYWRNPNITDSHEVLVKWVFDDAQPEKRADGKLTETGYTYMGYPAVRYTRNGVPHIIVKKSPACGPTTTNPVDVSYKPEQIPKITDIIKGMDQWGRKIPADAASQAYTAKEKGRRLYFYDQLDEPAFSIPTEAFEKFKERTEAFRHRMSLLANETNASRHTSHKFIDIVVIGDTISQINDYIKQSLNIDPNFAPVLKVSSVGAYRYLLNDLRHICKTVFLLPGWDKLAGAQELKAMLKYDLVVEVDA